VYNLLETDGITIIVANVQHTKSKPGRKTDEIPDAERRSAERIIAEIGIVMAQFRSANAFASWAGRVPERNESAGKKKSTRLRI